MKTSVDMGAPIKQDLYSHLTEVFNRILLHHPYDGFEKFEEISHFVKQTSLQVQDPKFDHEINATRPISLTHQEALIFIEKAKNLMKE